MIYVSFYDPGWYKQDKMPRKKIGIIEYSDSLDFVSHIIKDHSITGMSCFEDVIYSVNYHSKDFYKTLLKTKQNLPLGFKASGTGTHGIYVNQNTLVVAETFHDRVDFFDINKGTVQYYWPVSFSTHDQHHVNSVWYDGEKCYVSILGLVIPKQRMRWKQRSDLGYGVIVDLTPWKNGTGLAKVEHQNLSMPHSIHIHKNNFMFVEAGNSQLRINGKVVFKCNSFLRGLCTSDKYIYIGASGIRHKNFNHNEKQRIIMLDWNFKIVKELFLPDDQYGEIFDIIFKEK